MDLKMRMKSALYAGIIGDALGVPMEYSTKIENSLCMVKNELGYGRFDHPEGTWSDDTSLTLCTIESLSKGYDLNDLGKTFCKWLFESYWTPVGYVFDSGLTTFLSLDDLRSGRKSVYECGQSLDDDNGNGSLMRILPAALFFRNKPVEELMTAIHEISAVTHAHPRSKMACGIYALLVQQILACTDKEKAYTEARRIARDYYESREVFKKELCAFSRLLSGKLSHIGSHEISCSGYVIDTLEAALWCLLHFESTKAILMHAVELGLATDTNGTAAGGLAGLLYGIEDIPPQWIDSLMRKTEIDALIAAFVDSAAR
jgi:ADP-ribosylglycohydrolase